MQRQGGLLLVGFGLLMFMQVVVTAQEKPAVKHESKSPYGYDSAGTKLQGALMERKVYGPPGYGETPARDSHDTIFVLKLSRSISVEPAVNAEASGSVNLDPAENVREVQLVFDRSERPNIQRLIGHEIVVTGTLNESITASQYTKVWIAVTTLNAN